MRFLISALSGALFGLGLILSGMTDTLKVQGFLNLFGAWDPSLMFVMVGAIVPMFFAWRISALREDAIFGGGKPGPMKTNIDKKLLLGGAFFGIGWGLSGFCPGPALASVSFGGIGGVTFLVAMIVGMWGWSRFQT